MDSIKSDHWEATHLDFIVSISYRNTFCHKFSCDQPETWLRNQLSFMTARLLNMLLTKNFVHDITFLLRGAMEITLPPAPLGQGSPVFF